MKGIVTASASLLVLLMAAGCTLTAVGGGEEIHILAGERDGRMYYEPDVITVSAGARVTFVIKNEGAVDHEFESGEKGEAGVEEITIPPGRTRRVAWTAPSEPAVYTFYCDLPGHRAAGMSLTLRVVPVAGP